MSEVELLPGYVSRLGLGTIPRGDLPNFTGLELLQRLIDGHYPAPPIAGLLNFTLTEASEGRAVFRGLPGERHLNPLGGVHGGWTAAVMDSALACAVHTTIAKGEAFTTAEFKINLTRPILPGTGEVVCEAHVVHRGRTLAVSEASLKDGAGRLLAFGTETCAIFPLDRVSGR
jgi:uncharacterized protein (TIGR00369 family)